MGFNTSDGQSRPGTLGRALASRWSAFARQRYLRKQARIVEEFDDFRRRDIGLPPRGAPVRQVYYQW